jgi:hypothetical protein
MVRLPRLGRMHKLDRWVELDHDRRMLGDALQQRHHHHPGGAG